MKAKFLSNFDHHGIDVYSYFDLDTQETVWLEGGRYGKELKRFPKVEYNYPIGRAIDFPPRKDLFDYIRKNYPAKNIYAPQHDHWAI